MSYRPKSRHFLSILTATLLLSLTPSVAPWNLSFNAGVVQAQTVEEREAEAEQLLEEARFYEIHVAIPLYERALIIYQELGNKEREAWVLIHVGSGYLRAGQYEPALNAHQRSLALYRELGDREWEAELLLGLGDAYRATNDYTNQIGLPNQDEQGFIFHQQAIELYRELGDRERVLSILKALGWSYRETEHHEQAIDFYEQALVLSQELEDKDKEADFLLDLGYLYSLVNQYEKAANFYQQSLTLYQELGNKKEQAWVLLSLGGTYFTVFQQYDQGLNFYQQSLTLFRELGDKEREASILQRIGNRYFDTEEYEQALNFHQQSLTVYRAFGGSEKEAEILQKLGHRYLEAEQNEQARNFYQRALTLYQEFGDPEKQAWFVREIGDDYFSEGQYEEALNFHQQHLSLFRELGDREQEARSLENLGNRYFDAEQYEQAFDFYQQVLALYRELGDRPKEAITLREIGYYYFRAEQYDQAINFYQQYLALAKEQEYGRLEEIFLSLGNAYLGAGQYEQALNFHQQALEIYRARSPQWEVSTLSKLGDAYLQAGQCEQGLLFFQQALDIPRELGDIRWEAEILLRLGDRGERCEQNSKVIQKISFKQELGLKQHSNLEQQAQNFYRALTLYRQLGDKQGEINALARLGNLYFQAEQYEQAIDFFQQCLAIVQELGDNLGEAKVLFSLGAIHFQLQQYEQAFNLERQALAIYQQQDTFNDAPSMAMKLGKAYFQFEQYEQGLEFYQQSLALYQELGNHREAQILLYIVTQSPYFYTENREQRLEDLEKFLALYQEGTSDDKYTEKIVFDAIALSYREQEQNDFSLKFYQRALTLNYQLQQQPQYAGFDFVGQGLANIASVFADQGKISLAIVFYKAAINSYEEVRAKFSENNLVSKTDLEKIFLTKHEQDYRQLADLLLQQDRLLEAQRILDLLKVQELENYLRGVRGNDKTKQGIEYQQQEQAIFDAYQQLINQAILINQELGQLRGIDKNSQSPEEQEKIDELIFQEQESTQLLTQFSQREDIQKYLSTLSSVSREQGIKLSSLNNLSNDLQLQQITPKPALLYPLILENRLELILVTPDSPQPIRETVEITRKELNQLIVNARGILTDPTNPDFASLESLYEIIIKPLEDDLALADIETIIYAPDGQLRYIPISALYDGQQWLIEKYNINNITASSLTDWTIKSPRKLQILAGAFANGSYTFKVGEKEFTYSGLTYAGEEVETIAETITDTTTLVDQEFNRANTLPQMNDYSVVHFATHGHFVPGTPEDSFIALGNGENITLAEVNDEWSLNNIELIVLSACQTAIGGILGNGQEILGFGYLMNKAGAKSAVASLWYVDDQGTQVLMNELYQYLQTQNISKIEALKKAQMTFINNDKEGIETIIRGYGRENYQPPTENISDLGYSHPYYWSPFILIGNGL